MNTMKVKVIAGILVVFLLGVITGALGTGVFVMRGIRRFTGGSMGLQKTWFMRRLTRHLDLKETQKPEVEKILELTEEEIHELLQKSLMEFDAIMQRRNTQLKTILTPEQRQKLDEMYVKMWKHWPGKP